MNQKNYAAVNRYEILISDLVPHPDSDGKMKIFNAYRHYNHIITGVAIIKTNPEKQFSFLKQCLRHLVKDWAKKPFYKLTPHNRRTFMGDIDRADSIDKIDTVIERLLEHLRLTLETV